MFHLVNIGNITKILRYLFGNITNVTYICNVIKTVTRKEYKTKYIQI